jgi:hypothetical protein
MQFWLQQLVQLSATSSVMAIAPMTPVPTARIIIAVHTAIFFHCDAHIILIPFFVPEFLLNHHTQRRWYSQ